MEQKYEELIEKYETALSEWNRKSNMIGVIKLVLFFVCVALIVVLCLAPFSVLHGTAAGISFFLFGAACFRHEEILKQVDETKGLCEIVKKDRDRLTGEWMGFSDTGEEYADDTHDHATDLDIVGQHSLFQLMNRTNTYYGRERLASDLLHPKYSNEEIRQRQQAVKELREDYEGASRLEYLFSQIGLDRDFPKLLAELRNPKRFISFRYAELFVRLLCGVTCVALLYLFITRSNQGFSFFGILFLFQMALGMLGDYHIKKYLAYTRTVAGKIVPYHKIVCELKKQEFTSERLRDIRSRLSEAAEAVERLSSISSHMKYTVNPIARFLLDGLLLWSFKNAFDFQEWKERYADRAEEWFTMFGELESLLSFAGFARNCDTVCLPVLLENGTEISAEQIGHPLLPNRERVCNDFQMNDSIVIISGSNMSGKSTFMRSVGLNLVLAEAGSYVCAEQMICPQMRIVTSMRIADRTAEGISTFYSELLRIKNIITAAEKEKILFLIDEIFRGTNSTDRRNGAEGVIEKLHGLGACGIITTHDLDICRMADEKEIVNYSFYEEYREDEMYFDYRIKKGISKTRNAEYLLRKVGIL